MAGIIVVVFIIGMISLCALAIFKRSQTNWSDWDEEPITDEDFPDIQEEPDPEQESSEKDYLRQIAHDVSVIRTCVEEKAQ